MAIYHFDIMQEFTTAADFLEFTQNFEGDLVINRANEAIHEGRIVAKIVKSEK